MIVFIQKIEEGIVWSSWQLQQVFGGRDSDQKKKTKKNCVILPSVLQSCSIWPCRAFFTDSTRLELRHS